MPQQARFSQELLSFYQQLRQNNNREWFNVQKEYFKSLEMEAQTAVEHLMLMLQQHDQVNTRKSYRIYRDVRFSKNKLPYKTHFATSFMRQQPDYRGSYFLHVEPDNKSFAGVGFWGPSPEDLLRIRKELEMDGEELRQILEQERLKSTWGMLKGEQVKSAPKGFDRNHHHIDLLRFKQYLFTKSYSDKEVLSGQFLNQLNEDFKAIRPFLDYMSNVLTTNLNGEKIIEPR